MSFKITDYYLYRPKKRLKHKVAEFEALFGDCHGTLLTDLTLCSKVRDQGEFREVGLVKMKLLFLMELHDEYLNEQRQEIPLSRLLKQLLGEPPYREQIFDLWWIVERVSYNGDTQAELQESGLHALVTSEYAVINKWLERFQK